MKEDRVVEAKESTSDLVTETDKNVEVIISINPQRERERERIHVDSTDIVLVQFLDFNQDDEASVSILDRDKTAAALLEMAGKKLHSKELRQVLKEMD